jgi:hypothetical protein
VRRPFIALALLSLLVPAAAFAQDPTPPAESLEGVFPKHDHYSPYAGRNFATEVYWGDTHLHTGMSMDAGAFGARLMPDDAYRFAKGEEIVSSTGQPVKLSRPLDFLVVADHSDNMGFFPKLLAGDTAMLADPTGRRWYDMVMEGGQQGVQVAVEVIVAFSQNQFPPALASVPGTAAYQDAWEVAIRAADGHNDPGNFTAFIGYEWTSNASGNNLHRVVVYRDDGHKASMVEPYTTLPPLGSPDPRALGAPLRGHPDQGRRRDPPLPVAERRVRRLRDLGPGQSRSLGPQAGRHAPARVRPLCARHRAADRREDRRQPVQVRDDRGHRQPHRPGHGRRGQLLRQALGHGARAEAHRASDGEGR